MGERTQVPTVYILLRFTQFDELGVGTLESIALPKDFSEHTFVHRLNLLKEFAGSKKIIGVNWPKSSDTVWSLPQNSSSQVQYVMRTAQVITYSEDKDVVIATRSAMLKKSNPTSTQKATAKKSSKSTASNKSGTEKKVTSVPQKATKSSDKEVVVATRKSLQIVEEDLDGLDCELLSDNNDKTADGDSENNTENENKNDSTEDEDEDMIPPTPPPPPLKRKRSNPSSEKTADKAQKTHQNKENDFSTPVRATRKTSYGNTGVSHTLTSLDPNIYDTPPSSAAKTTDTRLVPRGLEYQTDFNYTQFEQDHRVENSGEGIIELKSQVTFLNEQIQSSVIDLENERQDFKQQIAEKDATIFQLQEEIRALKESNPLTLANSLKESLTLLQTTLENLSTSNTAQQSSRSQAAAGRGVGASLVKLHKDFETMIRPNALATAISYGKVGSKKKDMSKMINVIMEEMWDRSFMSSHSLTGKKAPTDKSNNPAKPALPKEDVEAITRFTVEYWETRHKMIIDPSMVYPCITAKLLSEHTAQKSREKILAEEDETSDPE